MLRDGFEEAKAVGGGEARFVSPDVFQKGYLDKAPTNEALQKKDEAPPEDGKQAALQPGGTP